MTRNHRIIAATAALGALLLLLAMRWFARPAAGGLIDGRLAPCPSTPNCVCSADPSAPAHVEPWRPRENPVVALAAIRDWMATQPGLRVVTSRERYLHVVATTPLLRFQDDVELAVDPTGERIDIRSASRLGYGDLGANRRRVARLRAGLEQAGVLLPRFP